MNTIVDRFPLHLEEPATALEVDFPIVEVSEVSEQESWRKEINRPIYHIHKWWATRLGSVFRAITLGALSKPGQDTWKRFYDHHDFSDKVVLDPFMGSGTTLGEAVKLGAKAIGCDINPVSTFLVRQAFARVPEAAIRMAFAKLESTVAPEIRKYYQTTDPETGEAIPVLYFFWCKTLTTPDGEEIPLLSLRVRTGRISEEEASSPDRLPKLLVRLRRPIRRDCAQVLDVLAQFNPQQGPAVGQYVHTLKGARYRVKELLPRDGSPPKHRLYAMMALRKNGEKMYLAARDGDHMLYCEAERRLGKESLPLPTLSVRPGNNTDQARGYNYFQWRDFFNARQQLCLGLLLKGILEIEEEAVQEQMLCLFSSTLEFNNLFCSFKGEGTGAVRHMFSNHILKPERTPLENSVWGTERSSGTFSTLFESRLLRAKRYLDEPFELELGRDLIGMKSGSKKTIASAPINANRVDSWKALNATKRSLMVLHGDSSKLPLPDKVVDAVVTDPPYFDFVHYSELSDFFFAWLSPVLRARYPWMARPDSSDKGEVQQKDPRDFANALASVFSECCRVLKDEGVLAFSFHHSRPEGWAAIYEALALAGLAVVAAHPVHAELRAASPKTAAKAPISLDAILVCRKRCGHSGQREGLESVLARSHAYAETLEDSGLSLSLGDRFVIGASQLLIARSTEVLSFEEIESDLSELHGRIFQGAAAQDVREIPESFVV